ncbi:MAG: DnaA/Hda family protein [Emcibacteraceae bacterium]|nr:DnaA/Hda family protein [Emcibacteraceae bacterium]
MVGAVKKNPEQLILGLPVSLAYSDVDFLRSSSNEEAVAWVEHWPNWPASHCLILYGPEGCGKTHLSHVWKNVSGAEVLSIKDLNSFDYTNAENFVFIVEDVMDDLSQKQTQEDLLHLYNWVLEQGGYLLLTSRRHPKNWNLTLADLSSRMLAAGAVKIKEPDDQLLQAVIVKQCADRQIKLSEKILNYIIKNTERSFSEVGNLIHAIDRISLSEKKKVSLATVKQALNGGSDGE